MILSTARLDRGLLEHAWADLTVTAQSGCTVQALQNTLVQHGQRLACDCLWPEHATIGGLLSTNDSGALRLRFGALRDLIIGVTLALPDGTLASSGGKVVENVAGYDLPKLVTGAPGRFASLHRAVFRVHPLPHRHKKHTPSRRRTGKPCKRSLLSIQDSKLAHAALQIRCALVVSQALIFGLKPPRLASAHKNLDYVTVSDPRAPNKYPNPSGRHGRNFAVGRIAL